MYVVLTNYLLLYCNTINQVTVTMELVLEMKLETYSMSTESGKMSTENDEVATTETSNHGKPTEFMCCLVTMEDITEDNYVEYQSYPSMKWKPALFEQSVIEQLLDSQFDQYIDRVKKTDCQAELRRLLEKGPPIYIFDEHGLALDDGDEFITKLWFSSDGKERNAKLKNCVEGKDREDLWESLNKFLIVEGKEEGDD